MDTIMFIIALVLMASPVLLMIWEIRIMSGPIDEHVKALNKSSDVLLELRDIIAQRLAK